MLQLSTIREDLKDIRYYYIRKNLFENATDRVGKNLISKKVKMYNDVVCSAPPRLYDIYVSLYVENNTQESLANKLGFTPDYIYKLNRMLVKFLQKNINQEEN